MHQSLAHAYQAYQKTEVTTLTQAEIIARLYEALENSLQQAKKAIFDGNVAKKGESVSRALAIITELDSALNRKEGGEIAENLEALYHYLTIEITEANLKNNPVCLENALKVVKPIKEAWQELSKNGRKAPQHPVNNNSEIKPGGSINASC